MRALPPRARRGLIGEVAAEIDFEIERGGAEGSAFGADWDGCSATSAGATSRLASESANA